MTELRRLQKEPRQGLRKVVEKFTDRRVEDTGGKPALADFTAPDQSNETIHEHIVADPVGSPEPADLMNPEHVDQIKVESPARVETVDQPIAKPTSNDYLISEATPNGIVRRQKNASGVLITMFPKTHYSAVPNVIVRGGPIAHET